MFHHLKTERFIEAGGRTAQFDGGSFDAGVSFFIVDIDPGEGPPLHRHTYPETWIVENGEAEFTVGREKANAQKGDIVVVPPNAPHKFVNVGSRSLNMVCIHAANRIEQENIDELDAAK